MLKKIEVVMADPAGNRTAIVRTPVPAADRPRVAAMLLDRDDLRAEQVGFETVPLRGGAGRLEMMGGEFCGNAARSYGYLLWCERQVTSPDKAACAAESENCPAAAPPGSLPAAAAPESGPENDAPDNYRAGTCPGSLLIEISGSPHPLEVVCDPAAGEAFAEMPMPVRLEYSREGCPMVVSEGITHMILEDTDPQEKLADELIDRYGDTADAFGIMFLKGDSLTPYVYVGETGSRVWESSCGSGSLAAAWYLDRAVADGFSGQTDTPTPVPGEPEPVERERTQAEEPGSTDTPTPVPGEPEAVERERTQAEEPGSTDAPTPVPGGPEPVERERTQAEEPGDTRTFRFREPGGELCVVIRREKDGIITGRMGGPVKLEERILIELQGAVASA